MTEALRAEYARRDLGATAVFADFSTEAGIFAFISELKTHADSLRFGEFASVSVDPTGSGPDEGDPQPAAKRIAVTEKAKHDRIMSGLPSGPDGPLVGVQPGSSRERLRP